MVEQEAGQLGYQTATSMQKPQPVILIIYATNGLSHPMKVENIQIKSTILSNPFGNGYALYLIYQMRAG